MEMSKTNLLQTCSLHCAFPFCGSGLSTAKACPSVLPGSEPMTPWWPPNPSWINLTPEALFAVLALGVAGLLPPLLPRTMSFWKLRMGFPLSEKVLRAVAQFGHGGCLLPLVKELLRLGRCWRWGQGSRTTFGRLASLPAAGFFAGKLVRFFSILFLFVNHRVFTITTWTMTADLLL